MKKMYGIGVTVVGVLACAYSVYRHYRPEALPPIPFWTIIWVLTWALLGYDIYIRRSRSLPTEPPKLVIHRAVYDVVGDCSMGEDPAGPWKYGYSQGVGNGFNPFKARHSDALVGVDRWFCPQVPDSLGVMHNRTAYTVGGEPPTYTIPANMMYMHSGKDGYCAVIRWQCPEDGVYTIQGSCEGLDKQTNADPEVHIMRNLGDLWHTTLGGLPSVKTFSLRESFESKDNLDFVVSQGVNWGSDSVGLKATIRKV